MFENYSDMIIILGTFGISFATYYYLINNINKSNEVKIEEFKDFNYNKYKLKMINKSGLNLKLCHNHNDKEIENIILNNNSLVFDSLKKFNLKIYEDYNEDNNQEVYLGESLISLVNGSDGIYLYDSSDKLTFNLISSESNFYEYFYCFEIN